MPIFDENTLEFISRSPQQTRRIGIQLGSLLKIRDVICLSGELGTGKTTLVQGIAQGWGSADNVTSPTFVLVNVYRRPDGPEISHLDAYRLKNALEAEDLDIDYMLSNGPLIVEWAEKIRETLPEENLWIELKYIGEQQRDMVFIPNGAHYEDIMRHMRRMVFSSVL
ncbi:MAG TPA: tRNA (adenosine(37)-N6)-threonylcarbamoyltransferase complex ATPase subunit type 1 TsaE [Anaerolineae bacterium]|nr:tRNA (adenosine(37)-N6)-threonylcarbamoyltransferase complex ATPase subunit type 1 TsaE [Anaerolineae bacterium]